MSGQARFASQTPDLVSAASLSAILAMSGCHQEPRRKNGDEPQATDAAVLRQRHRARGGPRARPRVDARTLHAARRCRNFRFRGVVRPAGLSAARDGGRVLDRRRATAPIQAVQASDGGGRGRSSTRLAQKRVGRNRGLGVRVLLTHCGMEVADVAACRRSPECLPLSHGNRVLDSGTPVEPSAAGDVPAARTITDLSGCFARNRTTSSPRPAREHPMGQLFRSYWIPALLASEELPEPDCPPVRVHLLSERLIAFRDTEGRLGLIDEFCAHRRRFAVVRPQRRERPALSLSRLEIRRDRPVYGHPLGAARQHPLPAHPHDQLSADRARWQFSGPIWGHQTASRRCPNGSSDRAGPSTSSPSAGRNATGCKR